MLHSSSTTLSNTPTLQRQIHNTASLSDLGVVEATVSACTHPSIILRQKLQDLKTFIRAWLTEKDLNKDNLIRELKNKVTYLELKAKSCDLDDNEIACRLSTLKEIEDMEYLKRLDLMQKAKIKWAIEGDENSKLFHGMINNKFIKSRINGLLINGSWTSDPSQDAVWSCGSSKAPGPDGFTFKFIKHHWDTIRHNFIDMVKRFEIDGFIPKVIAKVLSNRLSKVVHSVVSEVQTAYIKGKQIIDGPLMVNEILVWASKKKERLFFLKIHGCLDSSYGSIFINGSPTKEFKIQKGLRQGDPLSPFLFIIAMEALHVSIQDAKYKGILEGVNVGSNGINISHLQFSDDALIMGTWSIDNAKNLCRILRCFYMASGLKVNFSKNSLAFVLTLLKSVLRALGIYFFSLFKAPTSVTNQLEKLRRNFFWGGSLDRNKLAWIAWKKVCSPSNCEGLGIGSLYASNLAMLAKWWRRFHSETNSLRRSLIISIYGNRGGLEPMDHYPSRLLTSPWKVITGLNKHLLKVNCDLTVIFSRKVEDGATVAFWNDVWIGNSNLKTAFPRLYSLEIAKDFLVADRYVFSASDGSPACFSWAWTWRRLIRDGLEMAQLQDLMGLLINNFVPHNSLDTWTCSLDTSNLYKVSSLRRLIDHQTLESQVQEVSWNKTLPIKVNIHTWRLFLDRLPTRYNLDICGIDLDYTRCPICDNGIETANHVFVDCSVAMGVWNSISSWWGVNDCPKDLQNLIRWANSVDINIKAKACFDAVIQTTTWTIWRYRNMICFQLKPPRKDTLVEEIMILSHSWILHRNRKFNLSWIDWISNPIDACTKFL
ncbi:putative RNA-directed DNA polymerase [Tanacetum coccineum]